MSEPLKVYLAARYSRRNEIADKAKELAELGMEVTSKWYNEPENEEGLGNASYGQQDLDDIDNADLLVLFSENPDLPFKRGGRHFESGYAFGKGKAVVVLGPIENTFHWLNRVIKVDSWEELKANLKFLKQVKAS